MSDRFPSQEGKTVPNVPVRLFSDGHWETQPSETVFAGRTVVVFALPGAFTPTCSSSHLPRYEELYGDLRARGVDEVICLSVNDSFVMEAWARDQGLGAVSLLADGNAELSDALGMGLDRWELGFGRRSWRYSMLVRDGVIEKMFIEPDVEGDPYEVSDADTMLRHLDPEAQPAPEIALFTRHGCPHCARAKQLLDERGMPFEEIALRDGITVRSLRAVAGADSVPQVFIDGEHIGGADELAARLG
jgi:glutaredoxin-like protein